ncbi:SANT/Myb_domain [Hexamita inflata]|uniref:SANT/Myb domain n=1 Tax=Hexamita inflata TaxID=28002 RepID=A0AA86TJ94_9EUKA|nr:SANT/Myb domain [Hexamita inflata]
MQRQIQVGEQTSISDRSKRTWTQDERNKFIILYKEYKRDFKQYVPHFENRTESQIKSFYQNVVHNNKQILKSKNEKQTDVNTNEQSEGLSLIVFESINFELL